MLSMSVAPTCPFTGARRVARLSLSLAAALCITVGAGVPSIARAETGEPSPPASPSDVAPAPQPAYPPQDAVAPDPGPPSDEYADTDPSALTDFQQPLAPYGQWVQDPTYGTIWVPDSAQVGADFAPYQTGGQWATTDTGDWLWQSDYAWGYIPFHYGRWVWAGNSWGWIPGRTYAPAWVTWRVGEGGYVGWAPLPPTWYWAGGAAVRLGTVPYAAYCFVPTDYAFSRSVGTYVVRDPGLVRAAAASTRPYHAATPSIGTQGAVRVHEPASPRLSEAHIPASASPRVSAAADPRSLAFATRSSLAAARRGVAAPVHARGLRSAEPGSAPEPSASRGYSSFSSSSRAAGSSFGYTRPNREQGAALRTPITNHVQAYPGRSPSYHSVYSSYRPSVPSFNQGAVRPPVSSVQSHPAAPAYAPAHSSGGHFGGSHRR